jgi:hypothetical protein
MTESWQPDRKQNAGTFSTDRGSDTQKGRERQMYICERQERDIWSQPRSAAIRVR